MMKIKILGVLILMFFLNSCNRNAMPKEFDYGKVENNKYVNSFFDIEIDLPADWKVQTKEQVDELANKGRELVTGDDPKLKAILKASEIKSANLLSVFQFERGAAVEYNPNLSIVAENVQSIPGIKTGNEYLFHTRRFMEQSQYKYDYLDKEFSKVIINGAIFYKMNAELSFMGIVIKQNYYSTILNGFSLVVITSFINDQQEQELLKVLNSMKFNV